MLQDERNGPPLLERTAAQRLRGLLADHRRSVLFLAATSMSGGVLEALFLLTATRLAFGIIEGDQSVDIALAGSVPLPQLAALGLGLLALRVSCAALASWQSARLGSLVIAGIRLRLARAFLRSTWKVQHGERSGRLQELLTTFSQRGADLMHSMTEGLAAGFVLVALLLSAFFVDSVAALALAIAVLVLAVTLRPIRSAVRRQARSTAASGLEFATSLNEVSQLGLEMHIFRVQPQTETRVGNLVAQHEAATRRLHFLRNLVSVIYSGLANVALIGGLGFLAVIQPENVGSVGGVMLIMLRSLTYGQGLQSHLAVVNSSLPFLEALDDEISQYEGAPLLDSGSPIGRVGRLTVVDVSFAYSHDVEVLRSIDFAIEPHEVVGVVGPSGSGKSTLVQLLLALRDPTSGKVLADGRDVRELSRSEWARRVTFVPQQAHLLAGTISDNIRFLRDDVSQEQIEEASRLANLHDDVIAFPDGYERQVGEQGSHLSGGQQQRLIIARALVEDPDVLILDEPTSSLDVRSEHLIRQTLDKLRERMIIVIIAHRLSTLSICDRIMVIQDGELNAFDTPEKLEMSSEFYAEALRLSGLR